MQSLLALSKVGIGMGLLLAASSSFALMNCADFQYGSDYYHSNMEALAVQARLPDNYYTGYHEAVVRDMCVGDEESIVSAIDYSYVKRSEVEGIRESLGLDKRSEVGESYEYSRRKFANMDLSQVFSDNVANYYTLLPNSQCGQIAKSAIEGNPRAIAQLQSYPKYCIWEAEKAEK